MLVVGIEEGDPDLAAVSGIDGSRAVDDRDPVLRRETAAGNNERNVAVGERDRHSGGHRDSAAGLKRHRLGSREIRPGVTRMRVHGDISGRDEYIDDVGHVMRVVQNTGASPKNGRSGHSNWRCVIEHVTLYKEKLWPSPWLFISTALVIPASLLVFLPINELAGVIVAIVLYLGCVGLLLLGSPTVQVTETEFLAGRARLPIGIVGAVTASSGDDARQERGPRLDARAWLMIRGWIDPVVRVQVMDSNDPTPYWVVSTRHPQAVIDAVTAAKTTLRTPGR